MKKNIILKDVNDNDLFPLIDSENISIDNIKIKNYIDLKFNQIKDIILNDKTYKMCTLYNDYTVVNNNTYEDLTSISGTFNGRKNTNDNPFELDTNLIKINSKAQAEYNYTRIDFEAQFNAHANGNKYIKIDIIRDGASFTNAIKSVTLNNTNNGALTATLCYYSKPNDIIKFQVYGSTGDVVSKITTNIELENRFQNNLYCI